MVVTDQTKLAALCHSYQSDRVNLEILYCPDYVLRMIQSLPAGNGIAAA